MPIQKYLLLLTVVILAAGGTIALAYGLGLNFAWVAIAALVAALLVRKWK
jgi:hypothetical protein